MRYVIISHAHQDEVGGAKLVQQRYGARTVMGVGDWDLVDQSVNGFPNGKPRRDIVAADGMKITLGDRTVTLYLMPGHTPGTISGIFQVHDHGKPLTVAYSGGTEFNFVNDVSHFDTYLASERKFAAIAAAAAPPSSWETDRSLMARLSSSGRWPIGSPARSIPSTSVPMRWRAISQLKTNAQAERLKRLARQNEASK